MSISGISGVNAFAGLTSVSSITPVGRSKSDDTSASVAGAHRPKRDTFQSDLSSLVQAVRGGDISAAQSALSALQSDVAASDATYSPASTASTASTSPAPAASPAQSDLDALFRAVQSGDLAGAQAALGQLQSDVRGSGPHADHASLQGQIHGRGHGRGHGHQGSTLRAAVIAAFQSQTAAPVETPVPAVDPVVDPAASSVPTPAPATEAA